jgi:hypothetical protein
MKKSKQLITVLVYLKSVGFIEKDDGFKEFEPSFIYT